MHLTYADIPLLLPDASGHLQDWIDTRIPRELEFPDPISKTEDPFSSHGCFDKEILTFNYSNPPKLNFNEWYFPTGATRWGYGFFLASAEQRFHIVNANIGGLAPRELVFDTSDLQPRNANGIVTYQSIYMLTPRPFGGHRRRDTYENIPGEFWILPLVDKRYWWQFRMVALSKDYITTWEDMIQEIASQMGISVTIPGTISADFGWPDKIEFLRRENGAKLLDLAAACIGRRVALQRDGTVVLNTAATAYATVKTLIEQPSAIHKITGRPSMAYALMPSSIGLQFSQSDCAELPYEKRSVLDLFNDVTQTVALDDFFGAVPINQTEYVVPSSVRATAASAETDAMASAIARSIYSWWTTAYDFTASGVVPQWSHGLEDYVLIQYGNSKQGVRCQTHFVSFPPNCWLSQHFAQLTDEDRDCDCHPIVYAQAKEVILPGEIDAEMYLMEWDEIAGDYIATAAVLDVTDAVLRNCLLIGERAQVQKNSKSDRWELVGSQGLLRQVRAYEDIAVDATGIAWLVDEDQNNIVQITVENQTSEDLDEESLYHAEYLLFETGNKWVVRIGPGSPQSETQYAVAIDFILPGVPPAVAQTAQLMEWDAGTGVFVATGAIINVLDHSFRHCAIPGEIIEVKLGDDSEEWELVGSQGLLRQVYVLEPIAVGESGLANFVDENQLPIGPFGIQVVNQLNEELKPEHLYHAEWLTNIGLGGTSGWYVRIGGRGQVIKYIEPLDDLLPGAVDAVCKVYEWDAGVGFFIFSGETINVSDPMYSNCLLVDDDPESLFSDDAQAFFNTESNRWELLGSRGLLRSAEIFVDDIPNATDGFAQLLDHEHTYHSVVNVTNRTGRTLKAGEIVNVEFEPSVGRFSWNVLFDRGSEVNYFLAPYPNGLPAAEWDDGTETLTPTSTACDQMVYVAGELVVADPPVTKTILNASHLFAIPKGVPFKAIEIAGEWYAIIEHPVLVPLQFTQTGSGTSGTPEDYRYTVDDLQYGDQWTDVDIVATPHKYKRPEGNVQAATFGLGYRDWANDELVIMWTNERGLQSVRPLSLSQTGGANGDGSTVASWTYSVTDLLDSGNNLAGADPTASPHKWRRTAGLLTAATAGLGYLDTNGDLVITWINEYPSAEECE